MANRSYTIKKKSLKENVEKKKAIIVIHIGDYDEGFIRNT